MRRCRRDEAKRWTWASRCTLLLLVLGFSIPPNAIAGEVRNNEIEVQRGVGILRIDFTGNTLFSTEELKKIIDVEGPDAWFDKSGRLKPDSLTFATDWLQAFFYDNGFLNVRIEARPITPSNSATIGVNEGPLYRVGSIAFEGPIVFPREDLGATITEKSGRPFRASGLQRDVLALSDFYADRGYAYVYIDPRTRLDTRGHLVDASFYIKPGPEIRIGRITISGAAAPDDRLIREALSFREHQLYSAKEFRESKIWLSDLGIFSGVEITTKPSTQPNEIDVNVVVQEG